MPQPRRMRDASGLGIRSAGDGETGLFDLFDEAECKAGVDAKRALTPLPQFRHDVFVEPVLGKFVQRPDRDDCAVIGNLKVGQGWDFREVGCLNASAPQAAWPHGVR